MAGTGAACASSCSNALRVRAITGFTGSKTWPYAAMIPPGPAHIIDADYQVFSDRWKPRLDAFADKDVRCAHEVHPGGIAYDHRTSVRALAAIDGHLSFGFNWDPS